MNPWRIITPPVLEPITLAEAKLQCRVDLTDEDTLITNYIKEAREYCEGLDWRAYLTQTIELWLEDWPADDEIELPRPPLQSVTSVKYYDVNDVEYTFASTNYFVDVVSQPGRLHLKYLKAWPVTPLREYNAVCVTYVAGWTAAANVPQTIKDACLLLVGHRYAYREATITGTISREIEMGVLRLLMINRTFQF